MSKSLTTIKVAPYVAKIENKKFFKKVANCSLEVQLQRDSFTQVRNTVQIGGMSRRVQEEKARLAELRGE